MKREEEDASPAKPLNRAYNGSAETLNMKLVVFGQAPFGAESYKRLRDDGCAARRFLRLSLLPSLFCYH